MAGEERQLVDILDAAARQHDEAVQAGDKAPSEYTENAVARRFARQHAGSLLYDHSRPGWLVWQGSVWCQDQVGVATERIGSFIEAERHASIDPRERGRYGEGAICVGSRADLPQRSDLC